MITDAQFLQQEAEILAIFDHEATRSRARREIAEKVAHPEVAREMAAHEARVARILELAQYEAVVKDTASFLFQTLGTGIDGLAKAAFGALDPSAPPPLQSQQAPPPNDSKPPKRRKP